MIAAIGCNGVTCQNSGTLYMELQMWVLTNLEPSLGSAAAEDGTCQRGKGAGY